MKKIVITAGSKYIDIDVLACSVAYQELLTLNNINASVVLTGQFNKTIPSYMKKSGFGIIAMSPANPSDFDYVMVDVSDPKFFEEFVVEEQIIKVFDHHYGYKDYWQDVLGGDSYIEDVGSCATLIWEQYKKYGKDQLISNRSADLICMSIISNTLNFR